MLFVSSDLNVYLFIYLYLLLMKNQHSFKKNLLKATKKSMITFILWLKDTFVNKLQSELL